VQPRSDLHPAAPAAQLLRIGTERNGDSVTIALSGELDLASTEELDQAVRDCEETEIGGIVVDLTNVSFIDSSGLGALIKAQQRMGGRLRFVPSRHEAVTRLLAITRTEEIFN
jgi:anti-sigma B factor antagonist